MKVDMYHGYDNSPLGSLTLSTLHAGDLPRDPAHYILLGKGTAKECKISRPLSTPWGDVGRYDYRVEYTTPKRVYFLRVFTQVQTFIKTGRLPKPYIEHNEKPKNKEYYTEVK